MNKREFTVYVGLFDHQDDSNHVGKQITFLNEDNALNHYGITGKFLMEITKPENRKWGMMGLRDGKEGERIIKELDL